MQIRPCTRIPQSIPGAVPNGALNYFAPYEKNPTVRVLDTDVTRAHPLYE